MPRSVEGPEATCEDSVGVEEGSVTSPPGPHRIRDRTSSPSLMLPHGDGGQTDQGFRDIHVYGEPRAMQPPT